MKANRSHVIAGLFSACLTFTPLVNGESLSTTFAGGNSNTGIMFDVEATNTIRIVGFQVGLADTIAQPVTLFTKPGTHVGSEGMADDWEELGSQALVAADTDGPSGFFAIPEPILVFAGDRQALYIMRSFGSSVAYANGDGIGTLEASDANLSIFEGVGVSGIFGGTSTERIPNVTIYYELVDASAPKVKLLGKRNVKTGERRVRLFGLAESDLGIERVRVRYQKLLANGTKKKVTKNREADAIGLFSINVPAFSGRNSVKINAIDLAGTRSATARVSVVGE